MNMGGWRRKFAVAATAGVVTSLCCAVSSTADDKSPQVDLMMEIDQRSLDRQQLREVGQGLMFESANGVSVMLQEEPTAPIVLTDAVDRDRSITLDLPFSGESRAVPARQGATLTFDNRNDSLSSVFPHGDGSVQIVTTIESSLAPTAYEYPLDLPSDGSAEVAENGVVILYDGRSNYVGAVAAPWAVDSAGTDIETWYEVRGNTLVQMVEHTKGGTQYPVVADPWFGVKLFSSIWRDRYNGDYRYNGNVSWWGKAVMFGDGTPVGYGSGQTIMRTAGWDEWKSKYPSITNKATLKQQYDCHVTAGAVGTFFTGTYNIERFRRNNSTWAWGVWSHRCNW